MQETSGKYKSEMEVCCNYCCLVAPRFGCHSLGVPCAVLGIHKNHMYLTRFLVLEIENKKEFDSAGCLFLHSRVGLPPSGHLQ